MVGESGEMLRLPNTPSHSARISLGPGADRAAMAKRGNVSCWMGTACLRAPNLTLRGGGGGRAVPLVVGVGVGLLAREGGGWAGDWALMVLVVVVGAVVLTAAVVEEEWDSDAKE